MLRRLRGLGLLDERENQEGRERATDKTAKVSRVGNMRGEEVLHHTNADEQNKEACGVLLLPKKQKDEERAIETVHTALRTHGTTVVGEEVHAAAGTHGSRHIYEEELPPPHHALEGHTEDEEVNHVPHQVHRVSL